MSNEPAGLNLSLDDLVKKRNHRDPKNRRSDGRDARRPRRNDMGRSEGGGMGGRLGGRDRGFQNQRDGYEREGLPRRHGGACCRLGTTTTITDDHDRLSKCHGPPLRLIVVYRHGISRGQKAGLRFQSNGVADSLRLGYLVFSSPIRSLFEAESVIALPVSFRKAPYFGSLYRRAREWLIFQILQIFSAALSIFPNILHDMH